MNIKELRTAAGMTQSSLAKACGINISQVQKLEAGTVKIENVTLKNAVALAKALGIDRVEKLLEE